MIALPSSFRQLLLKELRSLSGLGILALFFGVLFQSVWGVLGGFLLFALLWEGWQFFRFVRWVQQSVLFSRPVSPPPNLYGGWEMVAMGLYRQRRAEQVQLQRLQGENQRLKAALLAHPDALIALSAKDKIEWLNPAAERLLGLKPEDKGKPIEAFIRSPEFIDYLRQRDFSRPLQTYSSINAHQVLDIQMVPYQGNHALLVVRDITELHKISEVRRDFVANASHELRTPLTVLTGYLELMADQAQAEATPWRQPLEEMQSQAKRMQNIIEDLLTLSSIENGGAVEEMEVIDVPNLLLQLEKEVKQLSDGKHHIQFEVDSSCGLYGHSGLIRSVMTNLLSNAVRYTPAGGRIQVRWQCREAGVIFEVSDTGEGIPREAIARVTERFYRVDTARSREKGGTGLGLSIVKHTLEKYEAQLEIESQYRLGSTFRCVFPKKLSYPLKPTND